jgi:hypothetical protein
MYYMRINKNFLHQAGDQPGLYYDARAINHQDVLPASRIEGSGKMSLRRPKLSTRKFSAWKNKKKKKN